MLRFRPRYLRRYRRIAEVLVRHGFGAIVAQLGLDQALDLRRRLAPAPEQPVTRKTAAVHLREAIEELGPTFIKFGQIGSTRPDVSRPSSSTSWPACRTTSAGALGGDPGHHRGGAGPAPRPAVSRCRSHSYCFGLAGTGVRGPAARPDRGYHQGPTPNIEKTIETDLAILADLARLAQERLAASAMDPVGLVQEFAESLRSEMDYRREGRNADRFRVNFAKEETLYVPKVYWSTAPGA